MIFCNLINSTGYFYRCKIELEEYIKLLQIILVHTLNYNFSYVLYEELVQKNVRMFFKIRDIPRNQPELINEIISELQSILFLPTDYALTFNNNSQNNQKLCYNIYFPVNIELTKINSLIDKFNIITKNKYNEYIKKNEENNYIMNETIINNKNNKYDICNPYELKTYHIRTINSGKIEYNEKYKKSNCRIIHNSYKLIHGNIEDTIIQNCDSLVLYNKKCIKYYELLEYNKLYNCDENNFEPVLSKKQKRMKNKLHIKYIKNSLIDDNLKCYYINNFNDIIDKFYYNISEIKKRIVFLKEYLKEFQQIQKDFIIYEKNKEKIYLQPPYQLKYSRYHPYNDFNSKTLKEQLFINNYEYKQELNVLQSRLKIINELFKRNLL